MNIYSHPTYKTIHLDYKPSKKHQGHKTICEQVLFVYVLQ